jgi:hypothetical protein
MRTSTRIPAFICLLLLLLVLQIHGKTIVSNVSGNWANSGTWNPMGIPACGDSIVVLSSHTITISNQMNYTSCSPLKIVIEGTLKFLNGSKLSLSCGSYVIVKVGGKVVADVGLSNSNFIEICGNVEWNSNSALNGPACLPPSHPICNQVLPVTLNRFTASSCDNNICLYWNTETENNCDHFEIQRSKDGIYFDKILSVPSKATNGYSFYKLNYDVSDNAPPRGINYYRLKQIDKEGSYVYSDILSIQKDGKKALDLIVYPNVSKGDFNILLSSVKENDEVVILLRNSNGEIIHKAWNYITDPSLPLTVSSPNKLQDGIYYCSLLVAGEEYNAKIVVAGNN